MQQKTTQASNPKKIIGSVHEGKYVPAKLEGEMHNEHSLHRQYVRDRMREDYAADIVQPYKNGQVNQEFIEVYGKHDKYVNDLVKE